MSTSTLLSSIVLEVLSSAIRKEKNICKFWKGKNKTDIIIDNIIVYLENIKDFIVKFLELIF